MKKLKIIPIYVFYIFYFVSNFIISFGLLRGWGNPNISTTNSINDILISSLGDLGVISLVFFLVLFIFKNDKTRVRMLTLISFIFTLFILFLEGISSMFSTFFSYSQLVSFKNPAQGKLIMGYILYFLRMFTFFHFLFPSLCFLTLFIIHFFVACKPQNKQRKNYKIIGINTSLIFIIMVGTMCLTNLSNTSSDISINGVYGSSHMGVYNYYIYNISAIWNKSTKLDKEKIELLDTYLESKRYTNTLLSSVNENKNLIIVQLEAINNFIIDLKIDNELIAPNLSYLASNGYYNSRFYSAAGMGNTSDCEFSSNIGLYPNGNDLSIFEINGENYPTIAKEFKELGYYTFSIHGNDGEFYNRNYQYINLFGFDELIDKTKLLNRNDKLKLIKNWISDESLLQESVNIYKEQTTPFFSYNILVSSHSPYTIVKGINEYKNSSLTSLANNYISYVRYVDNAIGNFITSLKENNLYENSIIVIYGDHTSSLLKKDLESITKQNYKNIEFRLTMQNVPFIILGNNIEQKKDTSVHSNIDIFPTLSSIFNLSPEYKFGVNMLSNEKSYVYNPRSLDLIFDDYVIMTPSESIYYINTNTTKLTKNEIKKLIDEFNNYKYINDLLLATNYLK